MARPLIAGASEGVRAALSTFIPLALIVLVAWATAGSLSGQMVDALRGSFWIWLGAHHLTFSLALPPSGLPGALSFLPLGALIFPFIAFRGALNRIHRQFGQRERKASLGTKERQGIAGFAISYTLILIIASFGSRSTDVHPRWWWAPVIVALLIFAAQFSLTVPTGAPSLTRDLTRITVMVVGALLGIGALLYSISLLLHFSVVRNLYAVLDAGIIGGVLLTILGILTLPNMAISSLSYLLGSGFSIGSGTLISPGIHRLNEIPAFPLLGAIPTTAHPYLYLGALIGVGTGIFLATILQRTSLGNNRLGVIGYPILLTGVIFALTLLSNGSVLGGALATVGPSLWQFPLLFLVEISLGMGLKFSFDKWGPK
jgi:hypothetical protein